ncbi:unnamed protein product [Clonostachys chloroleuca]|uniref:Protein kinase domain-containing protein n=1 Tax=Clonostachys chloroleuca TaxID=1926264 RepID=A0AA35MA44_9HYPO|nr:unnamed protein product [Clonostachys chloroleuca]
MPKKQRPLPIPKELPPCDGPKLNLFEHHECEIEWIERIGWEEGMGPPNEGYVFRVKINKIEYALKVFKFHNPIGTKWSWGMRIGYDVPLQTVAYYKDPFYNECQAYGRFREPLKGKRKLSDVAVPCHGFLFLSDRDQQYLDDNGYELWSSISDPSYQEKTIEGFRYRAIVKDLASPELGVTGDNLGKVLKRIVAMNQHKIVNCDIRLDNFRDGKIVDFGNSFTSPHIIMDSLRAADIDFHRAWDRMMFDQMPFKGKPVHNHLRIDPAGSILPLSSADYQPLRCAIRAAVFDALAVSRDTFDSVFVLTDFQSDEIGNAVMGEYRAMAARRGCTFVSITFTCSKEENLRRLVSSERSVHGKLTDSELAARLRNNAVTHQSPGDPFQLELDLTELDADAAARMVHQHTLEVCVELGTE